MEINNYDYISDLYDTYVPATFDIEFFIKETKNSPGEVLELMSGTGRVSVPLLQAGVKLTCVDLSEELTAVFRRKLDQRKLKADIYRMDIRQLEIPKKFGMIIIPFHSFAHIVLADDQRKTLRRIQRHLLPGGIFICTLGNPARRQKLIDGQLRLFGKYPLTGEQGTLLLWIMENYNSEDHQIVEASQFYEEYDAKGILKSKRLLELHFRLSSKEEFEKLAIDEGFKVKALYGDYDYAEFTQQSSPFMIWLLENAG